jgi:ubiquinone biosynthesis protein
MPWEALDNARDLKRLQVIAAVFIRYGFADVLQRIGLAGALERAGEIFGWKAAEDHTGLTTPARMRRAMEDLGPTFVKLGQILATRVDLLPAEWTAELGKLQDAAPAAPIEEVWAQLKEDLGDVPEAVFAEVQTQPLAAASLAQVHRARLADGAEVVLKVRRPGIRPVVEADLRLLNRLAEILEAEAPELQRYRPREVMAQFTQSLRRELDFSYECRNAERIAADFAACPEIVAPRIYWQWSGERLNVQEYIAGIPGRDLAAVDAAGLDRKLLARRGANAVLKMALEDGFFHADPHPGNIFYLPDNHIAFIDFGMIGRLSEKRRYEVVLLLHHLVVRDAASAAHVLLDWADGGAEDEQLTADIEDFLDQYHGVPLKQLDLGSMLSNVVSVLRNHGLALPADLALLIRVFIMLEGMGRQLDPEFDMAAECAPFLQRVLLAHYAPGAVMERGLRSLGGAISLLGDLPKTLRDLLNVARHGKLQAQIEVVWFKRVGNQIDRAASRLTVGVVTSSLVIGSSIVLAAGEASRASGLRSFGLLGFAGAALGGIWLLIFMWRDGRER